MPAGVDLERPRRPGPGPLKGPGRRTGGAFYNPAMRFARELSVLFTEERMHRHAAKNAHRALVSYRYLDALAATGARLVRIAVEARRPPGLAFEGVACDRDPRVVALLRKNIAGNRAADRVAGVLDDMHKVAAGGHWDHVDVDPFGSPAPFLDSAVRHLNRGATIALTATDTAALTGAAAAACRRRYDAKPWHAAGMHEVALRILAGAAVRTAARHEIALRPILAHATDHYVRVYLQAEKGAGRVDDALAGLGYALKQRDGTVGMVDSPTRIPADAVQWSGPMWAENLHDRDFVSGLIDRVQKHPQLEQRPLLKFLGAAAEETAGPPLHYEIGEIARAAGRGPPRTEDLMAALREQGHTATRCHTSPTGVKTDAPWGGILSTAAGLSTAK